MSDTPRCEPPPEWRERDGWYWLTHERWGEWPARYLAPYHPGIWPLWVCPDSNWTTPAAHREGYRYLAPVTPPCTVAALVEALEHIAGPDAPFDANPEAFGMHAARRMREQAAAALALYRGDVP